MNNIIDSISFLNKTLVDIYEEVQSLFIARRFLLLQAEVLIHTERLRVLTADIKNGINHLGQYLGTLS